MLKCATVTENTAVIRDDMAYNDRFRMTVKEFGRKIILELNRGTAKVSDDGRTVTITYRDSKTRKAK